MTNRLFVKIIIPIVFLMFGLGISWYLVTLRTINDFSRISIEKDLDSLSTQLFDVVDRSFVDVIRGEKADDQIAVRIKQVDCLDIIERYSFAQNFKIIVYREPDKKILLASDFQEVAEPEAIIRKHHESSRSPLLQHNGNSYYPRSFHFSPWNWGILFMKDTQTYIGLSQKIQNLYQLSASILLICTILLVTYLIQSIKSPITSIITSVAQGKPPEYQGTYEFEFLSRTIRNMMQSLQNSEARYRTLIDNAPIGIALVSKEGTILEANRATSRITGYHFAELVDTNVTNVYANPEDRKQILQAIANGSLVKHEIILKRKDKTPFIALVTAVNLVINGEAMTLAMFDDISQQKETEQKRLEMEKRLLQSQKMEAVGMMAGGVAHDLNNILSGIVGYPEVLLLQLPEESKLRAPLEAILESGVRAGTVVADLLTVARGAAAIREVHDLNTLTLEYLASPEYHKLTALYPCVTVEQQYDARHATISCSPVHIKKCIMNLVLNAAEAIIDEGVIRISTRNQHIEHDDSNLADLETGEYAVVSVHDSGPGISGNDLEHIFEPFYTKKIMGKSGTGLGLAVVWNSMQDHDGTVYVESSSAGTCFQLFFPVVEKKRLPVEQHPPPANFIGNGEHVLIVDDEMQIRNISTQMLQALGYYTDTVESGEAAVQFIEQQPVDLVVLDMLMEPGINGRQTYEKMLQLYPKQKALIASGFSESDEVKAALKLGANGFIKKPYTLRQLGKAVKEALQGYCEEEENCGHIQ